MFNDKLESIWDKYGKRANGVSGDKWMNAQAAYWRLLGSCDPAPTHQLAGWSKFSWHHYCLPYTAFFHQSFWNKDKFKYQTRTKWQNGPMSLLSSNPCRFPKFPNTSVQKFGSNSAFGASFSSCSCTAWAGSGLFSNHLVCRFWWDCSILVNFLPADFVKGSPSLVVSGNPSLFQLPYESSFGGRNNSDGGMLGSGVDGLILFIL